MESREWTIERYSADKADEWNAFVETSRNGTFLHNRNFMDYHADRFADCSLMARRGGKLMALLPANIRGEVLYSHQGLTYGGWLTAPRHFDGADMLALGEAWMEWCDTAGITEIIYKPVPHIYASLPAEEDEYMVWRLGGMLEGVNLSSAFPTVRRPVFETRQRRNVAKAQKNGVSRMKRLTRAEAFIDFVNACLRERHAATAVHTGEELERLMDAFPDRIALWGTGAGERTDAAVCVFDTGRVAHVQYIATSEEGRLNGALAQLFAELPDHYPHCEWIDYGTSNECGGHVLNEGLIRQKTELGGRGVCYRTYRITRSGAASFRKE